MRLKNVTPEALRRMNLEAGRCVTELTDARVDAIIYACLVAVMIEGKSGMEATQIRLEKAAESAFVSPHIISSASALVEAIASLKKRKVALIAPYKKPLTQQVINTIEEHDIEVVAAHSMEVADNFAVGQLNPMNLLEIARNMDMKNAEALILSACVQMPSLAAIDATEKLLGIPVISAATSGVHSLFRKLRIQPDIEQAGHFLTPSLTFA